MKCRDCQGRGWFNEPVCEPPISRVPCSWCKRKTLELTKGLKAVPQLLVAMRDMGNLIKEHLPELSDAWDKRSTAMSTFIDQIKLSEEVVAAKQDMKEMKSNGVWTWNIPGSDYRGL